MSLELIKLSKEYEKQLGDMIEEWKADIMPIIQIDRHGLFSKTITMISIIIWKIWKQSRRPNGGYRILFSFCMIPNGIFSWEQLISDIS